MKDMQNYPSGVKKFFDILTTYCYPLIFPVLLLFNFFSPDKKFFVLAAVVIGGEAFMKKFFAVVYREERPFMIDE